MRPIATERNNRRNDEIRSPQLRVIDAEGKQVGVLTRDAAMSMAAESAMDLVEIDPNAVPPVCRIMDWGKFRFEQQKKANAARKKTKQIQVKEIKFRPSTDQGDYLVKLRNMKRFIEEGDKVKVTVRFRGRELAHMELGQAMLDKLEADMGDDIVIEQRPRMEGRMMVMLMAPKKR